MNQKETINTLQALELYKEVESLADKLQKIDIAKMLQDEKYREAVAWQLDMIKNNGHLSRLSELKGILLEQSISILSDAITED